MRNQAYPFGWMGVALASMVALLLTHHKWHAAFLGAALLALHLDLLRELMQRSEPAQSPLSTEIEAEDSEENEEVAA